MTTRSKFEQELNELNIKVIRMASFIENNLNDTVEALIMSSKELAMKVIDNEEQIDIMATEIESIALKIILKQQPVARDLRLITAVLKIVTDIARIGNQSKDICDLVETLFEVNYIIKDDDLVKMTNITKNMVSMSINSFSDMNLELAYEITKMDDIVDKLFVQVKENMIQLIQRNTLRGDLAIYIMMIAKYLEKIADHAENIAEWVIFCQAGVHKNIKIL